MNDEVNLKQNDCTVDNEIDSVTITVPQVLIDSLEADKRLIELQIDASGGIRKYLAILKLKPRDTRIFLGISLAQVREWLQKQIDQQGLDPVT